MPIYVYQCKKCKHEFEEIQKFDEPPLTECRAVPTGTLPYRCDGKLEKQTAQRGAFHFAGPGWSKDSYHNPWGQGNKTFEDTTLDKSAESMGWDQGQRDDIKQEAMEVDELYLPGVHKVDKDKKGHSDQPDYDNQEKTMSIHEQIKEHFETYLAEHEKWEGKGVKAAATRARKALGELGKLSKHRRAEIQDKKNAM